MTPKEQVKAFFDRKIINGVPDLDGLHIIPDPNGVGERPPFAQSGTDWFGVKWIREDKINASNPDPYQEPVLEDITEWREVVQWPDLDAFDWSFAREADNLDAIDRENKMVELFCVNGPFERLYFLMGFENALCAMLTDPEEVSAFFDKFMEWKCKLLEKMKEVYNPDIIMFLDDWGTQTGPFFSPEMWRSLIKPQIKKAVDKCHELGMYFEMHSCGLIEDIVPDFVEIGVDSWQGQEINDVVKLKSITGNKLAYHTMPIYQIYFADAMAGKLTEDELEEKVKEEFDRHAKDGNYLPLMLPFGDWVSGHMFEQLDRLSKEYSTKIELA